MTHLAHRHRSHPRREKASVMGSYSRDKMATADAYRPAATYADFDEALTLILDNDLSQEKIEKAIICVIKGLDKPLRRAPKGKARGTCNSAASRKLCASSSGPAYCAMLGRATQGRAPALAEKRHAEPSRLCRQHDSGSGGLDQRGLAGAGQLISRCRR
ncbi:MULTISPECIES: hypothetical protein [Rhodanobacter]|uniref:hypothetical protein n=1 Tax=Rhodanobacter TaxID=75309 RepID=UPI000AEC3194|nr:MULTISPECIES: hypothetical protein [Rhodanobacter]UJJ53452.1 hypothetical protein LRK53_10665 [Rhodanobacter thiooxydans]